MSKANRSKPLQKPNPDRARQLVEAAIAVFGRKGYLGTQISDIIEEAGVARGTFYLYFEGKREIFSSVLEHIFSAVNSVVERLPRDAVHEVPDKIRGNLDRIIHLLIDKPEFARVLLCESVSLDSECDEKLKQFYDQLLFLMNCSVTQGQEMGFVRQGNSNLIAIFLLGMIKELLYQKILNTTDINPKEASEELFQTIVSCVARPEWLALNLPQTK